jgi:alkylhydroperoxidase family enzyme
MAPRVAPVSEPSPEQREALAKTYLDPSGEPLAIFATLARQPRLLRRVNALGGYFLAHSLLPFRDREIVVLRTSALSHSHYEASQHRLIGARAGLTPAEIEAALEVEGDTHKWSTADGALLALVAELFTTDDVSDAIWEQLGQSYDDDQRIELILLVGFYRMLAGFLNGVGVEVDESIGEALAD